MPTACCYMNQVIGCQNVPPSPPHKSPLKDLQFQQLWALWPTEQQRASCILSSLRGFHEPYRGATCAGGKEDGVHQQNDNLVRRCLRVTLLHSPALKCHPGSAPPHSSYHFLQPHASTHKLNQHTHLYARINWWWH